MKLGWRAVARTLLIEDVDGGRFSMLQEPYADVLANMIADRLARGAPAAKDVSEKHFRVNAA